MNLVQRLQQDPVLRQQLLALPQLTFNYRWEQKDGKERAYIEILPGLLRAGAETIRLQYQRVVQDSEQAKLLLERQAQELVKVLRTYNAHYSPSFRGYYLYGERREYYFPGLHLFISAGFGAGEF
ncbi:MAG: hypothetical protein AABX13_04630 [Nanoarchaeota archaeon]